ncbi:hypothetical protein Ancab_008356 [Ancistrocladus abbreviatus]
MRVWAKKKHVGILELYSGKLVGDSGKEDSKHGRDFRFGGFGNGDNASGCCNGGDQIRWPSTHPSLYILSELIPEFSHAKNGEEDAVIFQRQQVCLEILLEWAAVDHGRRKIEGYCASR